MARVTGKPPRKTHQRPAYIHQTMELEERLAAMACQYTWEQYLSLPGDPRWIGELDSNSKAMVIATYRAKRLIDRESYGS